ncbi:MAG: hypothetical protein ACRDMJ_19895 [Solirubrobacteraceae bacterium]
MADQHAVDAVDRAFARSSSTNPSIGIRASNSGATGGAMNAAIAMFRSLAIAALAVVAWVLWAEANYAGQTGCPWSRSDWQAWLVGVLLALAASGIGGAWERLQGADRPAVAGAAFLGAIVAGIGILVAATFFGAGMHCTD